MNLADPYLKTSRAHKHLEDLRHELDVFYESKPYAFVTEDDIKNQRYLTKIDIDSTPDTIPLIFGDFLYCLRSSLDQLVWCLAKLTTDYPEKTQFPILERSDPESIKRFNKQTTGVPADATVLIDSFQPYRAGDADAVKKHLLWRLNKLGNIDKHTRIPSYGGAIDFKLPNTIAPFVEFSNTNIMSIPLARKSQMTLYPNISFKVIFGDLFWGIECDFAGAEQIYKFVTYDLLPRFARFLK